MAYKDKEKQKEANRQANKRYRERSQGITQEDMKSGITQGITVISPLDIYSAQRWEFLQSCGYVWDGERGVRGDGVIGVTVPGDPGYQAPVRKAGKLPPDVQADIEMMASRPGADYELEKKDRTSRALAYQAMYPDGWRSREVALTGYEPPRWLKSRKSS